MYSTDNNSDSDYEEFEKLKSQPKGTIHICLFEGCNKQFGKPSRLLQHERTHTGERPFKCDEPGCNRSYSRQQHLTRHQDVSHRNSKQSSLVCEICSQSFKNKYNLQKHQVRVHVKRKYDCSMCKESFVKQQQLRVHSYVHTGIKPYKCEHDGCDMTFKTPSKLRRHVQIHIPLRYKCIRDGCTAAFNTYLDLNKHVSVDHPQECDICKKPFNSITQLKKHRETHSDVRVAYYCLIQECGRCYYDEKNLKKHIADVHKKQASYECETCHRYLSTKQKLEHHIKQHLPGYKPSEKPKKSRKPRKDKGALKKKNLANLLSGYNTPCMSSTESLMTQDSLSSDADSGMSNDNSCSSNSSVKAAPYHHIKTILFNDL